MKTLPLLFAAFFLGFLANRASAQTNVYLFNGVETNITLSPGFYNITAYGAQGGNGGGLGAEMSGDFSFSGPTTLTLLVGGAGYASNYGSGGGGGGSFVVDGGTPMVVAGGGGGSVDFGGGPGLTVTSGGPGGGYETGYDDGGGGGSGGNGGGGGSEGGGGGGFSSNGGYAYSYGPSNSGGNSFMSGGGGGGGQGGNGNGGYGGGAGGGYGGGGGGGGYSGGGGGGVGGEGGGGGSIIDSSAIADVLEVSGIASPDGSPNGEIIITESPLNDVIILTQPSSQTVVGGQTATFSVVAANSPPFSYQWLFDGTNIAGATNATYSISDVQSNNDGAYSVVVSDAVTNVNSSNALLTVIYPLPVLTLQPTNCVVVAGSNAIFTAGATSYYPMSFQWQFDGTDLIDGGQISGSTNSILTVSNAQAANMGTYELIVANSYGAITSSVVSLVIPSVQITSGPTNEDVLLGTTANLSVVATGDALGYQWYFDGSPMSDGGRISGSATANLSIANLQTGDGGDYWVVITNTVSSVTSTVATLAPLASAGPAVRYVNLNNPAPASPYLSWSTAATNIQTAINACVPGDQVIVSDGVYQYGGQTETGYNLTNRVFVNIPISIQSVNGPLVTEIQGNPSLDSNAVRCVYLANGASLNGFTLMNGSTMNAGDEYHEESGSGVFCESTNTFVLNCVLETNTAAEHGGGAYQGTLNNCLLNDNSSSASGGGAQNSTLTNCVIENNSSSIGGGAASCAIDSTMISSNSSFVYGGGADLSSLRDCVLTNNSSGIWGGGAHNSVLTNCLLVANNAATSGGGVFICTLVNCTVVNNFAGQDSGGIDDQSTAYNSIIYYNTAGTNLNYAPGATRNYCCTTPAVSGVGNITNEPLFLNISNDFHISYNSPCFNAGSNAYVVLPYDLDGNPRISDGVVDMGAYEFQYPYILISEQPSNQTDIGGQEVILSTEVTSPVSLNYQWQFNGEDIPGATNSSLIFASIQSSNAGVYNVIISNWLLTTSTSNAVLTVVYPPPMIVSEPTNVSQAAGANATFSVNATSYYPMTLQWQFNGTNLADGGQISGSATSNLTISGVQDANSGAYQVIASNTYGAVTSSVVSLAVYDPVQIIGQPSSQSILSGSNISFTVTTMGTAPNYHWYFNGAPLTDGGNISGSMTPTLTISSAQTSNTGGYFVLVTNLFTSAMSSNVALAVYNPVQITVQPVNVGVWPGSNASFTVTATGTALGYQWYFNGNPLTDGGQIGGSATPTLTISDVESTNLGSYMVDVTNLLSATNSLPASLTLASIRYVNVSNTTPQSPYTNWSMAASDIQSAINVSGLNDLILVTNGVYQTGGEVNYTVGTNRVAITAPITVQSVNGPAVTIIQGYQMPGTTNGNNAVRCVFITNNAALIGFTLSNGATVTGSSGGGVYCQSTACVVSNCVIIGNSATSSGGGVYLGSLFDCTIIDNSVFSSGYGYGGGAYGSHLENCLIVSNSVQSGSNDPGLGGGTYDANLTNCAIADNVAVTSGGGVSEGTLVNCDVTGNLTYGNEGGGSAEATLVNCIVYYNQTLSSFAGENWTNYYFGSLQYCCTTPYPGGSGNIAGPPLLASIFEISSNSPCRGAGNAAAASGVDINGNPWANPPSIGCEEPYPGSMTGSLDVNIGASVTNIEVGYPINFQANISGPVNSSTWNFGDGTVATNQAYISHTWSAVGSYPVVLTAYNDSYPAGVPVTNIVSVYQPTVFYVVSTNHTPTAPYDTWAKAATNIQSAINAAIPGGLILVSNGVYNAGVTIAGDGVNSRVVVTRPMTLQSVNGPAFTLINGNNQYRCIYLTNGAVLNGFTLTNGSAANGGGVYCGSNVLVENCVIIKNTAGNYSVYSGTVSNCMILNNSGSGTLYSTLYNCLISSNANWGAEYSTLDNCQVANDSLGRIYGGAYYCTLNNCIISNCFNYGIDFSTATACQFIGNAGDTEDVTSAAEDSELTNCLINGNNLIHEQGAVFSTAVNCTIVNNTFNGEINSTLLNCILYYNGVNNFYEGTATNCCVFPLPSSGFGNITNAPLFVNVTNNFHLQSTSPCINSGNNAYITDATDLDGNPRIVGGTVDIGAYEYQTPTSVISYAYLQQYGLPTDGSVDNADLDGSGLSVYQDWIDGLNPTSPPLPVLVILPPLSTNSPTGVIVTWKSISGMSYFVQRSTNLVVQPPFSTIQTNIVGQTNTTSYLDTSATNNVPYFYRVGVP